MQHVYVRRGGLRNTLARVLRTYVNAVTEIFLRPEYKLERITRFSFGNADVQFKKVAFSPSLLRTTKELYCIAILFFLY